MNKEELELDVKTLASIANYWEINEDILYYSIDYQYIEELYIEANGNIENMFLLIYKQHLIDISRLKNNTYAPICASADQQVANIKNIISETKNQNSKAQEISEPADEEGLKEWEKIKLRIEARKREKNKIESSTKIIGFKIFNEKLTITCKRGGYKREYDCSIHYWIQAIKSRILSDEEISEPHLIEGDDDIKNMKSLLEELIEDYTLSYGEDVSKYGEEFATINLEFYKKLYPYVRFLQNTLFISARTKKDKVILQPIYTHICSKLGLEESKIASIKKYIDPSFTKFAPNYYSGLIQANKKHQYEEK